MPCNLVASIEQGERYCIVAPAAHSSVLRMRQISLTRCIKMYVPKKRNSSSVPCSRMAFNVPIMCEGSKFSLRVEVSSFPCGRIRLIARSSGLIVTGNMGNFSKDITFDSVKSLYSCPHFSILTPPGVVYAFCGRNPRRIW